MDIKKKIDSLKLKPSRVLSLGIIGIIFIGSILLNLPMASKNGESIGFINAFFTATSSVSLTGLIVVNTAFHWTVFGKVVIIVLIQMGGLGFMTLTTMIAMILGKKIGLRDRLIIQEQLNQFQLSGVVKLTKYVVKATLLIESIGALFLSFRFIPKYGLLKGILYSVFHSISAYCNAGFDIIGNSMVDYVGDPILILGTGLLIIVGGLGYTVYLDLINKKFKYNKLSLHSKLVLKINALLLLIGFLFILVFEYNNKATLGGLNFYEKIMAAIYQSIVPRTAGFNSVDIGGLRVGTAFMMIILMFIGGSPSSTAGGIKTTTFGVLLVTVISTIRGKDDVEIMEKRLSNKIIKRAVSVVAVSGILVTSVVMILSITENHEFIDLVFETISGFATVGVTRGITPDLTDIGKIIIALTMFTGKVGPLTLVLAVARRNKENDSKLRYPEDRVMIG